MKMSYCFLLMVCVFLVAEVCAMKGLDELRIDIGELGVDNRVGAAMDVQEKQPRELMWHMKLERLIGEAAHADLLQDHPAADLHEAFSMLYADEHPDLVACVNHKSKIMHQQASKHRGASRNTKSHDADVYSEDCGGEEEKADNHRRHQKKEHHSHQKYGLGDQQDENSVEAVDRFEARLTGALLKVLSKNERKKADSERKKAEEAQVAVAKAEANLRITEKSSKKKTKMHKNINLIVGVLAAAAVGWAGKCQVVGQS
ncbi:MAG: hypothetical protein NT124_01330 [Candidatus Dependentiae bacterium]|nr:hypothetical protein [Candidatus Dependentiae bacterium]